MMPGRSILVGVIIAAAVALPATVYLERDANARLAGLKLARAQFEAQRREIAGYREHLVRYRAYVDRLDRFVAEAREVDLDGARWDRHEVRIKDMFLGYDELVPFLDDMRHGPDSFFVPAKAHLKTRPTINREEAAAQRTGKGEPEPGGIVLSLEGEFLVRR